MTIMIDELTLEALSLANKISNSSIIGQYSETGPEFDLNDVRRTSIGGNIYVKTYPRHEFLEGRDSIMIVGREFVQPGNKEILVL